MPGLGGEPGPRRPMGFPGVKGAAGKPGRNAKAPRVGSQSRIAL